MIAGRLTAVTAAGMLVVLVAAAVSTGGYQRPGRTERVSVGIDGAQGNADSRPPSVSADGRYVTFSSSASNLVPGDTNQRSDVFLHDRETRATERVSVGADGVEASAGSLSSAVSADGRYVAFESAASNLVFADTNGSWDVLVRDRQTGTTERVSMSSDGTQGNNDAFSPSISADGRYVAFYSPASNLVPGDTNAATDVFVRDRQAGTTQRVSVATDGTQGAGYSFSPSISPGGRYVAFWSGAPNLVSGDTNGKADVFVRDRQTGTTERVSVSSDGQQATGHSYATSISADGRLVAFESWASNLVPGDANAAPDVFVHDRQTGITERVSVGSDGAEGNGYAFYPSISADGRYVTFYSLASNLVPGDTGTPDVLVRDRETGITERVSVGIGGAGGNGSSASPSISADGRYVAFDSEASNLVPGDTNGNWDVFARDRGPAVGVGELSVATEMDRVAVSGWATFAGAVVASASDPGDDGAEGAGSVGAELTGASLTYRPEQADLLVRLRPSSLPGTAVQPCVQTPTSPPLAACLDASTGGGAPGILYGLAFELGGARFEVRAARAGASSASADPSFALYRCDPVCTEDARLSGGMGTTGVEVVVSVPLSALGAEEGTALSGLRAVTALGESATGALVALDEAELPDATIPAQRVSLGIAPAGTSEQEVEFETQAGLEDGSFSGTLDVGSLPGGSHDVWARACLGQNCGAESTPVTVRGRPDLAPTALSLSPVRVRGSDLVTFHAPVANLRETSAANVVVRFLLDGLQLGSDRTLAELAGDASVDVASDSWSARHHEGTHTVRVVVDPADRVAESNETNNSATATFVVRGNKVENGSFEQSANGSAPDGWTSSDARSYDRGGAAEGEWSVSAGAGGSWTSDPVAVEAGRSYQASVRPAGAGGTLVVEQLAANGAVLASAAQSLLPTASFAGAELPVTALAGATQVRVVLLGGLLGTTTFDDVWLTES